jgi:mannose-6-phosphate isomerase class I
MPDSEAIAAYVAEPTALVLRPAVQHYDWGGFDFIPGLIGVENTDGRPFAELWIGAHPGAPSVARVGDDEVPLNALVTEAPEILLGARTTARFQGRLPYLFKVLDARKMLSIQAHPSKQQAEEGFEYENSEGIPLGAPNRNYKDDNHKPEVHVALTDFWMLHGFRPLEDIGRILREVPEFRDLMSDYDVRLTDAGNDALRRSALLRDLYSLVMTMPQDRVDFILQPLLNRLRSEPAPAKDSPDYWALRAAEDYPLPDGHVDRGIFSVYLLNLVHLRPGQGTFQPAGTLHAYLEGVNVELMANSDNVLRGGLTPKHVDVRELLNTLVFEGGKPQVLNGERVGEAMTVYHTPAEEFELSRVELAPRQSLAFAAGHGPDALVVIEGEALVTAGDEQLRLGKGGVAFVPDSIGYGLAGSGRPAVVFRASTPRRT